MVYSHQKKKTARQFVRDNLPKIIVIAIMVLLFIAVIAYRICADAKWNGVVNKADVNTDLATLKTVEVKAGCVSVICVRAGFRTVSGNRGFICFSAVLIDDKTYPYFHLL